MLNYFGRPHFPEKSEAHSCTQQLHLGRGLLQETRLPDLRERLRFPGATRALFGNEQSLHLSDPFGEGRSPGCTEPQSDLAIVRGTPSNERSRHLNHPWKEARSPDYRTHRRNLPESPAPSGSE